MRTHFQLDTVSITC